MTRPRRTHPRTRRPNGSLGDRDVRPRARYFGVTAQREVETFDRAIAAGGLPNYFGVQRFGREGDNVEAARRAGVRLQQVVPDLALHFGDEIVDLRVEILHLGAELGAVEIERLLAAAIEEQVGLDLHGILLLSGWIVDRCWNRYLYFFSIWARRRSSCSRVGFT